MPTTLGRKYPIEWRGTPPAMLQSDVPVWYRFLDKYKDWFSGLYYNVEVGGPFLSEEDLRDPMKRMWRANLCKRIDVLAELETEIWIIEVAANPGQRSLGQLLNYQTLWLEDSKINKMERLILVCERIDEDIGATYGKLGVLIYIV